MRLQRLLFVVILFLSCFSISSQIQDPTSIYRKERDKINNLVHTKLKVSFNFDKKELNGEEWLTLKPHFYPTKQVVLDAKAMIIHRVSLNGKNLDFTYDGNQLVIDLQNEYTKEDSYTLYLKYTARPEKVKEKGSAAISSAKGLYFINPTGAEVNKPTQIWTQGETEASSCWFPTIDSPNQKTSQEIYITVPNKFKTLSNGALISQKVEGTNRTDYWKFDQKHAPYLFFMGVGEYEVIQDSYKNIPVNYYVEKKYASLARKIFGLTPEMIGFFENKLGVDYPWNKYSQLVARDYVSGAMENTTAVIHGESAYQMKGQLVDENRQENTISHEIFHHWFGNLVTSESWSNLALNESFANYSQYLWREFKYGKTNADAHLYENSKAYLDNSDNYNKKLAIKITTNGIDLRHNVLEKLLSFKKCDLNISVDGYKHVYEYIRYPGKWEVIDRNLKKIIDKQNNNFTVNIHTLLNIYNLFDIPNIEEYLSNIGYNDKLNVECYIKPYHKSELNVKNLTKDIIVQAIESNSNDKVKTYLQSIKDDSKDKNLLYEFIRKTKLYDKHRNQSYSVLHPSIVNLVKEGINV